MGHIDRSSQPEEGLTTFLVHGEVTCQQIIESMVGFLESAPSIAVIWDFRAGSLVAVSRDELREIVLAGKPLLERRRGGRTAIVVGTALDYGLARMFQILGELERLPIEHLITRDADEARTWVLAAGGAAPTS